MYESSEESEPYFTLASPDAGAMYDDVFLGEVGTPDPMAPPDYISDQVSDVVAGQADVSV